MAVALRTRPPFRADHVGSLLRPRHLLQAREDHAAGRIDAAELRALEDGAIREIVAMQEEVGLRAATDGEFRRASWHMDFIYQLDGITKEAGHIAVRFFNENGELEFTPAALHVDGPLGVSKTIFGDDFSFLRETVTTSVPKLTIPSPSMVHYRGGKAAIDPRVYPDLDVVLGRPDGGVRGGGAPARRARLHVPPVRRHEPRLPQRPAPARVRRLDRRRPGPAARRVHPPHQRGARRPPRGHGGDDAHVPRQLPLLVGRTGGYDFVAEALFNELQVDGFFMEWDDERSGGFEPLRFVPPGKQVVLGLVTTKRGELEAKDELKRRIEEASRFVDVEQLCLSPQCGFSSTLEGNELSYEQQVAKLRLIVEVADEVWG